ncbi:MAG: hypothetical protein AAF990_27710, partial [Bacteroidota bacterium]
GFQSISWSQNPDKVFSEFTATDHNSPMSEKITESLDRYLTEKLDKEYGGQLSISQVSRQSEEIFVIGEFKDASLHLGGRSTFNAYLVEQVEKTAVTEFCYYQYDQAKDKQALRCLENSKKIENLQE